MIYLLSELGKGATIDVRKCLFSAANVCAVF